MCSPLGRRDRPRTTTEGQRRRLALALLCSAQFIVILDTTIVNVALPAIDDGLGFASQAELQYVISLYALTVGGLLILAGRVADLFGRRRVLGAGLVVFAAASLACGLGADR
jgi:MFS family permease